MLSNGIPTVILGAARDIVTHCGVPRFAFVDFPLGNPSGKPYDRDTQAAIANAVIDLFETAAEPGTVVTMPFRWSDDESWRDGYFQVNEANIDALRRAGEERRAARAHRRATGQVRTA
ncbi:MAG: hypothetical protein F4Z28_07610 [Gammaproteobacteria bacterium]|nr:hypothetical protein [Gammaproteobacteria bacterium]